MKPLLCLMISLASGSQVQALPDTTTASDIVVTALRRPVPLAQSAFSVFIMDETDLKSRNETVLSAVLRHAPNSTMIQYGGPGQVTGLSIRGADTDQTLYILNGIRLSDPSSVGANINPGLMSADDLSRVEIVRGPLSTLWGSRAFGGVVSLTTRAPSPDQTFDLRLQGTKGAQEAHLGLEGVIGALQTRIAFHSLNDRSVSAFAGGAEKDGFVQNGFQSQMALDLGQDFKLTGFFAHDRARTDFDGFPAPLYQFGDTGEFSKTAIDLGGLALKHQSRDGKTLHTLSVSATHNDSRFFDTDHTPNFLSLGHAQALDYQVTQDLEPGRNLILFMNAEHETMKTRSPSLMNPNPQAFSVLQNSLGAGVSLAQKFTGGGTLTFGTRVEKQEGTPIHWVSQAGFVQSLTPQITTHVSWGQGFKAASLFQRFSPYGQNTLRPERAIQWEVGTEVKPMPFLDFSLTAFGRTGRDQIDFVSCYGNPAALCSRHPDGYYDNIARTRTQGLEAQGTWRLGNDWRLSAQISQLRAQNQSPDSADFNKDLARRPKHTGALSLSHRTGKKLNWGLDYIYTGKRFDDAGNSVPLKAYGLWQGRVDFAMSRHLDLYGRVENASDAHYQSVAGYGHEPRRLWVGIRVN